MHDCAQKSLKRYPKPKMQPNSFTSPPLDAHATARIEEMLAARERSLITSTIAEINKGPIDAQYAIQQWRAVAEIKNLRNALLRDARRELPAT